VTLQPGGTSVSAAVQTQTGWGRILASFSEWCQVQPDWRVLDVGCGPGLLPALFAQSSCQAFGLDLDEASFSPPRQHPVLLQADALHLPFPERSFHLVTASNLLFLLAEPLPALCEMSRVTREDGSVAVINPSETMSLAAATSLADQHRLVGVARESLLTYAARAEIHQRWNEAELHTLFSAAGLHLDDTALRMGPGLVRFGRGLK
jgi:ubiquinone/menaquinone biosynthesis C-methylase UbiE